MEDIRKSQMTGVQPTRVSISQTKREQKVFNIPFDERKVANGIWYFAKQYVENRGCVFELTEEYRDIIRRVSYYLVNERRHFGLLVNGDPGNGKTTLAYAILSLYNQFISEGHIDSGSTYLGKNYMHSVDARDFGYVYCSDDEKWNTYKTARYLIIDDLGEDPRDVMKFGNLFCPFIEILEYRYKKMYPTIIFSNLSTKKIVEKYHSDRLQDRMREMFTILPIYGKSFRKS